MTVTAPRDSTIAVVGEGFGSLIVYSTAVYLGFHPQEITIFGTNDNPVGTYQQYATNLGQTVLRSESESHFLPADWPTFGQLDAWSHKSPAPLWRSIKRKYNPGVSEILTEAGVVQRRLNWNGSRMPTRIGWLQRELSPTPHFVLYDEDAQFVGRAKHVMLALGHGPLTFPPVLAKARAHPAMEPRIVQAYEPKQYAPNGRYVVLGAGIASINEWANALDEGAKSLRCVATRHRTSRTSMSRGAYSRRWESTSFRASRSSSGWSSSDGCSRAPLRSGAHGWSAWRRAAARVASRS